MANKPNPPARANPREADFRLTRQIRGCPGSPSAPAPRILPAFSSCLTASRTEGKRRASAWQKVLVLSHTDVELGIPASSWRWPSGRPEASSALWALWPASRLARRGPRRRRSRAFDVGELRCQLEADAPRVRCSDDGVVATPVPRSRHAAGHTKAFDDALPPGRAVLEVGRRRAHADGLAQRGRDHHRVPVRLEGRRCDEPLNPRSSSRATTLPTVRRQPVSQSASAVLGVESRTKRG